VRPDEASAAGRDLGDKDVTDTGNHACSRSASNLPGGFLLYWTLQRACECRRGVRDQR